MALTSTMYRFAIAFSDVDRGVYQTLDLRAACHPSETMRHLLVRTLAYCLAFQEGIAFGKGLSAADEPALWVKDLKGDVLVWIEVGGPSAERLHKAAKSAPRVLVFTHHDPQLLRREWDTRSIHRSENIEVFALAPDFLDQVSAITDRNNKWELLVTGDRLYLTAGGRTIEGNLDRHRIG